MNSDGSGYFKAGNIFFSSAKYWKWLREHSLDQLCLLYNMKCSQRALLYTTWSSLKLLTFSSPGRNKQPIKSRMRDMLLCSVVIYTLHWRCLLGWLHSGITRKDVVAVLTRQGVDCDTKLPSSAPGSIDDRSAGLDDSVRTNMTGDPVSGDWLMTLRQQWQNRRHIETMLLQVCD